MIIEFTPHSLWWKVQQNGFVLTNAWTESGQSLSGSAFLVCRTIGRKISQRKPGTSSCRWDLILCLGFRNVYGLYCASKNNYSWKLFCFCFFHPNSLAIRTEKSVCSAVSPNGFFEVARLFSAVCHSKLMGRKI
jgi:hypothetical protein